MQIFATAVRVDFSQVQRDLQALSEIDEQLGQQVMHDDKSRKSNETRAIVISYHTTILHA